MYFYFLVVNSLTVDKNRTQSDFSDKCDIDNYCFICFLFAFFFLFYLVSGLHRICFADVFQINGSFKLGL